MENITLANIIIFCVVLIVILVIVLAIFRKEKVELIEKEKLSLDYLMAIFSAENILEILKENPNYIRVVLKQDFPSKIRFYLELFDKKKNTIGISLLIIDAKTITEDLQEIFSCTNTVVFK